MTAHQVKVLGWSCTVMEHSCLGGNLSGQCLTNMVKNCLILDVSVGFVDIVEEDEPLQSSSRAVSEYLVIPLDCRMATGLSAMICPSRLPL